MADADPSTQGTPWNSTLGSASNPPPLPPPLPPQKSERLVKRAPSLPAILGGIVVVFSLFFLVQVLAGFVSNAMAGRIRFQNPAQIISYLMWPAIGTLSVALIGTMLGWIGLAQIRKAFGQRRGLLLGTIAALTWPLLVFTLLGVLLPAGMISGALERQGTSVGPTLMLGGLVFAIIVNLLVSFAVARWAASIKRAKVALPPGETLSIRHWPTLTGLVSFLFLVGAVALGMFTIKTRIETQQEIQAQIWNQPQPEGFDDAPRPQPQELPQREARGQAVRPMPVPDVPPIQPGDSLKTDYALFPERDATSELRITFWSNGLPVDLPELALRQVFTGPTDAGLPAEWNLQWSADSSHYTLTGPDLNNPNGGAGGPGVRLEIPPEVQMISVPSGATALRAKSTGPARRWLFLSMDDARLGAQMNAVWGVSLDLSTRK